jgi:hypothetical protein
MKSLLVFLVKFDAILAGRPNWQGSKGKKNNAKKSAPSAPDKVLINNNIKIKIIRHAGRPQSVVLPRAKVFWG